MNIHTDIINAYLKVLNEDKNYSYDGTRMVTRKPTEDEEKANKALADKWKKTATQSKEDYLKTIRTDHNTQRVVSDMIADEQSKKKSS